jgi:hypothetical protein
LKINSGLELLCGSYFDGSFQSYYTSSFLDINFAIVSVFVGLKSRSTLLFGAFFPNTGYARVIVFIKDNSFFTNIICNILKKKKLKVSDTSFLSFKGTQELEY